MGRKVASTASHQWHMTPSFVSHCFAALMIDWKLPTLEIEIFRHFYWSLTSLEVVKGQYFLLSKFSGFLCSSELPSILLLCTQSQNYEIRQKKCCWEMWTLCICFWLKTCLKFYSFQRRFSTVFHNYRKLENSYLSFVSL